MFVWFFPFLLSCSDKSKDSAMNTCQDELSEEDIGNLTISLMDHIAMQAGGESTLSVGTHIQSRHRAADKGFRRVLAVAICPPSPRRLFAVRNISERHHALQSSRTSMLAAAKAQRQRTSIPRRPPELRENLPPARLDAGLDASAWRGQNSARESAASWH